MPTLQRYKKRKERIIVPFRVHPHKAVYEKDFWFLYTWPLAKWPNYKSF